MNKIIVENGDTFCPEIKIINEQPEGQFLYIPQQGEKIRVYLYDERGTEVATSESEADGEQNVSVIFNTNIPEGDYLYTVKLTDLDGNIHTVIKNRKISIV